MKRRHDIVYAFSEGTFDNSSDLSDAQIDEMIEYVQNWGHQKETKSGVAYNAQRMRRRILSICYTINWVKLDPKTQKLVVDMDRLNSWFIKYSYLHKPMNDYKYDELGVVVTQFERLLKGTL